MHVQSMSLVKQLTDKLHTLFFSIFFFRHNFKIPDFFLYLIRSRKPFATILWETILTSCHWLEELKQIVHAY